MGCTVSQSRIGNISLAQTPRERIASFKAPSTHIEDNNLHQKPVSYDVHDKELNDNTVELKRRYVLIERKKFPSNTDFLLRRTSSKSGLKESAHDFSFKNSIESSQERDNVQSTPQSSRRQSYNNITEEPPKKCLEEIGNTIFGRDSFGLKLPPSPNVSNRSSLLLEKRSSRPNSATKLVNPFTGQSQFSLPSDFTFPKESNMQREYQSPRINSSIETKIDQRNVEPKFAEQKMSTLKELFPIKRQSSGSRFLNEQVQNNQSGHLKPVSKTRLNKLSLTSTELITYEVKPAQPEKFKNRPSLSTMDSIPNKSITAVGSRTLESQTSLELNSTNLIKSPAFWKCESQSSIEELLLQTKKQETPTRPMMTEMTANNRRKKSFASLRASSLPQNNASLSSKDFSDAQSSQQYSKNNTTSLSVIDKFKRNLLEIVRGEETNDQTMTSQQNDSRARIAKLLMIRQQRELKGSLVMEPIAELDSPSSKSKNNHEKADLWKEKVSQMDRNSSRRSLKEAPHDAKMTQNEQNSALKKGGNLINLARDEVQEQSLRLRRPSIEISISKIERLGSNQILSMIGFGHSTINQEEITSRPTFPELNNSKVLNNQSPTQKSILSETCNRTIYNIDENVSPGNISKFDFAYEHIEVEYDGARGTNRSQVASPAQRVLSEINSPIKYFHKIQAPDEITKQDPPGPSHSNLIKLCALRREGANNVNNADLTPLSRKDSIASLSSIHCPGNAESNHESRYREESLQLNHQFSDPLSNERDNNSGSPLSKKHGVRTDPHNHKPLRLSIFQHESDLNSEAGTCNSQGEDQKQESAKLKITSGSRQSYKNIHKSKSVGYPPVNIQEADSKVEQSDITKIDSEEKSKAGCIENPKNEKQLLAPSMKGEMSKSAKAKRAFYRLSSENRDSSKSPSLKGAVLKKMQSTVIETNKLDKTRDEEGQKRINQYLFIKDLGRGGFGKVKLAQNAETKQYFAVKIANKAKIKRRLFSRTSNTANPLEREVAIMKKLEHPHVARLWEVIDDPKDEKFYLVMDLIKKGAVMSRGYWKYENNETLDRSGLSVASIADTSVYSDMYAGKKVLSEEKALKYFRELILGLDYLHNHAKVIHRDIKPENLLIDEFDVLKISDFGVSLLMEDDSDELKNSAGTKLFLPPESFQGKSFRGKPADVWAAGATLFYFLTGKPPFMASNPADLMQKVLHEEVEYPDTIDKRIQAVIQGCLKKDPQDRMTIQQIMASEWLTEDGAFTVKNIYEDDGEFLLPSEQEVMDSLTKLTFRARVMLTAKLKMHLNRTRDNIERQKKAQCENLASTKEQNNPTISNVPSAVNENESNQTNKAQLLQRARAQMKFNLLEAVKEDD